MRTRGGRSRTAAAVALTAAMLWGVGVPDGTAAGAAPPGLRHAGRLALRLGVPPLLTADVGARRLFQIGRLVDGGPLAIDAYDLDSLARVGTVVVSDAYPGGPAVAVDEARHRLFQVFLARPPASVEQTANLLALGGTGLTYGIAVVDTLRMKLIAETPVPDLVPAFPLVGGVGTPPITGIGYSPTDDKLHLISQETLEKQGGVDLATNIVVLHQLDVPTLLAGTGSPVDWSYPVPSCPNALAPQGYGAAPVMRVGPSIFFSCKQGVVPPTNTQQPGSVSGMARVTPPEAAGGLLDLAAFESDFYPISGVFNSGGGTIAVAAVDPVAHRFFLQNLGAGTFAPGIWVFDAVHAAWTGLTQWTGGSAPTQLAVDATRGRVYVVGDRLLLDRRPDVVPVLVSDGRTARASRGVPAEISFVPEDDDVQIVGGLGVADGVRRRLFVHDGGGTIAEIYEDLIPTLPGEISFDPDSATIDAAEVNGATASSYSGGAQAFGVHVALVGGTNSIENNIILGSEAIASAISPVLGTGSRELFLAAVPRTALSNNEATASAIGADRDTTTTDADLERITRAVGDTTGNIDLSDRRWPFERAQCVDFGNADDTTDDAGPGATAACERGTKVEATAVFRPEPLPESLRVAGARSTTSTFRDPVRGVVTVTEAEAVGIDVGGVLGIGRVRTRAETLAAGRPGTASSTFTREIEQIWVRASDGSKQVVCEASCDQEDIDAVNELLGVKVRLELPTPDPTRAKGTPRGYEALVVRDFFEHVNDIATNDAPEGRLEVPGLVVTVFNDGNVRSRLVLSLAGVQAESHYGIYRLPGGAPTEPLLKPPAVPLPPFVDPGTLSGGTILPPASPASLPGLGSIVRRTFDGLRFAVSSPYRAFRAAGAWALLALPLVLLARRRFLPAR